CASYASPPFLSSTTTFYFTATPSPRDLHSFPTRRSSDLTMLGATLASAQAVGGLAADKVGAVKTAAIASLPQQGVLYHGLEVMGDRKSTRLNSSHLGISYAVFCLKKKTKIAHPHITNKYN